MDGRRTGPPLVRHRVPATATDVEMCRQGGEGRIVPAQEVSAAFVARTHQSPQGAALFNSDAFSELQVTCQPLMHAGNDERRFLAVNDGTQWGRMKHPPRGTQCRTEGPPCGGHRRGVGCVSGDRRSGLHRGPDRSVLCKPPPPRRGLTCLKQALRLHTTAPSSVYVASFGRTAGGGMDTTQLNSTRACICGIVTDKCPTSVCSV